MYAQTRQIRLISVVNKWDTYDVFIINLMLQLIVFGAHNLPDTVAADCFLNFTSVAMANLKMASFGILSHS